jgi:hypothetical protein
MRIKPAEKIAGFEVLDYGIGEVQALCDDQHSSGRRRPHFDAVGIWGRIWKVVSTSWMYRPGKRLMTLRQTSLPDWYCNEISSLESWRFVTAGYYEIGSVFGEDFYNG